MKRYILVIVSLFMLFACKPQDTLFNLEKDGVIYNYNDIITFYYPRDWIVTKDELKLSLDITNENQREAFYFDTFETEGSNDQSDLIMLYEAKLKDLGVEINQKRQMTLQSGQLCFYLEGRVPKSELSFCEAVVFFGQKQYIYSYIADDEVFAKNNEVMKNYLMSFVVNEAIKTAL